MARQLFGTDGIRGVAGTSPLDPKTVYAVGAALGEWIKAHPKAVPAPQVVIGMDTRESGPWIAETVAAGLASQGVTARLAGLITTPGVAYLTRMGDFAAGVMISASHNPFQDNGIKVFGHNGYKFPDEQELELERNIFRLLAEGVAESRLALETEAKLDEQYLSYLASTFIGSLSGLRLVIDCGNGAAAHLGPSLLRKLGAEVIAIGCEPNGRNINLDCGALHVDALSRRVVAEKADAGFAFDGDADRCIAVAASGQIIDGDAVMLLIARHLKSQGKLTGGRVVATVMSNLGLQKALETEGIELVRTSVGDKYVLEEMLRLNAAIGGEQSGHVIMLQQATTGDGLLTSLRVLEVMVATGKKIDELVGGLDVYPQTLVNVRVKQRKPLAELAGVNAAIDAVTAELGSDGRVLVRFSGTEPLARVMVEGPTVERVKAYADRIADAIRAELAA
ncbi:MAG: phosphoglucosamine mutase [Bryobacteraceae bacterium]